nr:DinB family protein [candidate division Zixibacteria bacterium]
MFHTIEEFTSVWKSHTDGTRRVLNAITDQALAKEVTPEHRNVARLAWHLVTTIPEMAERTGLQLDGPKADSPLPKTVREIREGYDRVASSLQAQVEKNWDDADLQTEDNMYGQMWKKNFSLKVIIDHEIHHRGQLTVLMRQAGLKVPGIFGPSKEEWAEYGMKAPEI